MVDVSEKSATERIATAEAIIVISQEAFDLVCAGEIKKGDVLATARIAGIMGAKKTSELIPLCHPLALTHAGVEFTPIAERHAFRIIASAKTMGQTGVEMEALTAASVAALTVYDMVKAVDKGAVIESIRLLTKSGGKSGSYDASNPTLAEEPETKPSRSTKVTPRVLLSEAGSVRPAAQNPSSDREALRKFMVARHLRATEWAKSAGMPINELYGYLSGRSRALSVDGLERLAKAARTTTEEMFGRGKPR